MTGIRSVSRDTICTEHLAVAANPDYLAPQTAVLEDTVQSATRIDSQNAQTGRSAHR
jgi:hypothetical protein